MKNRNLRDRAETRKGFTLIELSIALIIIGLLVAGIMLGQSLIRSSNVQTLINDVAAYQSAAQQFKQKYGAVPGDMSGATGYWGTNANCSTGGSGTGTQTCNGNGDGLITLNTTGTGPYEQFLAWQHLADGGFINGVYTGAPYASGDYLYCSAGSNCPGGKVSQAQSYLLQYSAGALGSTSNYWAQAPGHYLIVGRANTPGNYYPAFPLLSASEAASLDGKVDDGLPGQGIWKSFEATGGAGYLPHCVVQSGTSTAPVDGTIASAATGVYNKNYGNPACAFEINLNF